MLYMLYSLPSTSVQITMNLLILLLVHVDVLLVWGQAPGDFQGICRTDFRYRIVHDWIPYVNDTADGIRGDVKWQVLIDQYDYQNILGEISIPPGVWTEKDLDGDNRKVWIMITLHVHTGGVGMRMAVNIIIMTVVVNSKV